MKLTIYWFTKVHAYGEIDTIAFLDAESRDAHVRSWIDEKLKNEEGDDWRSNTWMPATVRDIAAIIDHSGPVDCVLGSLFCEVLSEWNYSVSSQELDLPQWTDRFVIDPPAHSLIGSPAHLPTFPPAYLLPASIPHPPINPLDPHCQSGIGHPASGIPPQ